jgi:uncharacterized protein
MNPWLDLADWRQRVTRLYLAEPRAGQAGLQAFRRGRDLLFREHPQSPLTAEQRQAAAGLPWFPYSPAARVEVRLEPVGQGEDLAIDTGGEDGVVRYRRVGRLATPFGGLTLLWTLGYGGGLFLPFRDATAGGRTYGAGRYLTDTIKGTIGRGLEVQGERVILDFNYAYKPRVPPLTSGYGRQGHTWGTEFDLLVRTPSRARALPRTRPRRPPCGSGPPGSASRARRP